MTSIREHGRRSPGVAAPDTSASVESVYARLAPVYDLIYGSLLQHGRRQALTRLNPRPGETVLEVGVGTGLSAVHYPAGCSVVAVDLSAPMLTRAARRMRDEGLSHVRLCRMDAGQLGLAEGRFDAVYAPYLLNVVPEPERAAREIVRVCRPGGRVVFLNHFERHDDSLIDRMLGRVAGAVSGVNWHLDLEALVAAAGLTIETVDDVNLFRASSVVRCRPA